jgi:hypothetical protein
MRIIGIAFGWIGATIEFGSVVRNANNADLLNWVAGHADLRSRPTTLAPRPPGAQARGTGDRQMDEYPFYGGPNHGKRQEEAGIVYAYRPKRASFALRDAEGKVGPGPDYIYHLYDIGDGKKAFLPRDDADLLAAYQQTAGDVGDPPIDALLGEMKWRGLDA